MKKLAVALGLVAAVGAVLALVRRKRSDTQDLDWAPSYSGDGEGANDLPESLSEAVPDEAR